MSEVLNARTHLSMKFPSYRLGRLWGINVFVHSSFFLLVLVYGLPEWSDAKADGLSNRDAFHSVANLFAVICGVFGCVVLHEYGHALTARRFGIRTANITLYPIGGVALLEEIPRKPMHELIIAVMGPAVNLLIIMGLLVMYGIAHFIDWGELDRHELAWNRSILVWRGFFKTIFWANVAMIVFNMIPAFPMDGGRVLRALLAMKFDRVKATDIAARVAKVVAIAMGLLGYYYKAPFVPIIALFVWIGASREAEYVREEETARLNEPRT